MDGAEDVATHRLGGQRRRTCRGRRKGLLGRLSQEEAATAFGVRRARLYSGGVERVGSGVVVGGGGVEGSSSGRAQQQQDLS